MTGGHRWLVVVVALAVIVGGGVWWSRSVGRQTAQMLAIGTVGIILVTALVAWVVRTTRRESEAIESQTNAGFREFARRAGLRYEDPQPPEEGYRALLVSHSPYGQVTGKYRNIPVRVAVESPFTDELRTVMLFPNWLGPWPGPQSAFDPIQKLVKRALREGNGLLRLELCRRPPLLSILDWGYLPDADPAHLLEVLERVSALATVGVATQAAPDGRP